MKIREIDDSPEPTDQQKTLSFYKQLKQKDAEQARVADPLALLDAAFDEAVAAAAESELDRELAEQGLDPDTLTQDALELRRALRAESLRRPGAAPQSSPSRPEAAESSAPHDGPSPEAGPAPSGQQVANASSEKRCAPTAPSRRHGVKKLPREKRFAVGLRTDSQLVKERAALEAILHRVQSRSGLCGRIGCKIDVGSPSAPKVALPDDSEGDRHPSIDLLLICRSPDSFSSADAASAFGLFRSSPDFRFWRTAGRPRTLFLVGSLADPAHSDSARQPERAVELRHADADRESVSLLLYDDPKELEQSLQRELVRWLLETRFALQTGGAASAEIEYPPVRARTTLCISVGGAVHLGDGVRGALAIEHLWNRVGALIGRYQAALGGVYLDIAFFHFHGDDSQERAVKAANLLLRTIPSLIDGVQLGKSPEELSVRLAVHNLPDSESEHPALGIPEGLVFLAALTERPEADAGVLVTSSIREHLPTDLSARCRSAGRFCGEPLWLCESRGPTVFLRGRTERQIDELNSQIVRLETAVQAVTAPPRAVLDVASTAVDKIYALLELLAQRIEERRQRAPGESAAVTKLVEAALAQEERTWKLISGMAARRTEPTGDDAWKAPVYLAAARRGPIVARLRGDADADSTGAIPTPEELPFGGSEIVRQGSSHLLSAGLLNGLRHLVHGDDLDRYTTFTNLASKLKGELSAVLGCGQPVPRNEIQQLGSRLWNLVDLVVAEDQSEPRRVERCLLPQIVSGPFSDPRFVALCHFLYDKRDDASWGPEDALRASGAPVRFENVEELWLCRLLTARDPDARRQAVEQVGLGQLWHLLTYPRTPWPAVVTIVERFAKVHLEGHGQICFDCLTSRLARSLEADGTDDSSLPDIKSVLKVYARFDFSAATSTFERLRKLVELFFERAGGSPRQAEEFWRESLEDTVPASVRPERLLGVLSSLPMVVQRHLASEGLYIEHFACHPDYRIARETARFIRPGRLKKVVAPGSLNGRLLRDLLIRSELWNDLGDLEAVLKHPKCDPSFASHQLSRLSKPALLRIVRNPGANPQIRKQAGRIIHVHGFHPRDRPGPKLGRANG